MTPAVCQSCKLLLPCDVTPRGRVCRACQAALLDEEPEPVAVYEGEADAEERATWPVDR